MSHASSVLILRDVLFPNNQQTLHECEYLYTYLYSTINNKHRREAASSGDPHQIIRLLNFSKQVSLDIRHLKGIMSKPEARALKKWVYCSKTSHELKLNGIFSLVVRGIPSRRTASSWEIRSYHLDILTKLY